MSFSSSACLALCAAAEESALGSERVEAFEVGRGALDDDDDEAGRAGVQRRL